MFSNELRIHRNCTKKGYHLVQHANADQFHAMPTPPNKNLLIDPNVFELDRMRSGIVRCSARFAELKVVVLRNDILRGSEQNIIFIGFLFVFG